MDASGVRSRKICRRAAHFSTISTCGATTARWIASITCFMWRVHDLIHPADIQDLDGRILLLATPFGIYPFLEKLFADGGAQGPDFEKALGKIWPQVETSIVKVSDRTRGFVVLPRRWVVERNLLGSTAAEGLPRIGRTSIATRWRSCVLPQSASCSENF